MKKKYNSGIYLTSRMTARQLVITRDIRNITRRPITRTVSIAADAIDITRRFEAGCDAVDTRRDALCPREDSLPP